MKNDELKSQKRRYILFGGFLVSAGAIMARFFGSGAGREAIVTDSSNPSEFTSDNRLAFIKKSRDLHNYLSQIEIQKNDFKETMQAKFPELMPQFTEKLGDEYWKKYQDLILESFHADTKKILSEEDAAQALRFFESSAGQSYLRWKDLIQSRDSELFKAVKKMSDERGFYSKQIIDEAKAKKA